MRMLNPQREILINRIAAARALVTMTYCLLFMLLLSQHSGLWPSGSATWSFFIFKSIPMAIMLPFLLSNSARGHCWIGFITLFYFITGVLNTFNTNYLLFGLIQSTVCFILFSSAILYARWYSIFLRQTQQLDETTSQEA